MVFPLSAVTLFPLTPPAVVGLFSGTFCPGVIAFGLLTLVDVLGGSFVVFSLFYPL